MSKVRVGRVILEESTLRPLSEGPLQNQGRQFNLSGVETSISHSFTDLRRIVSDITLMYGKLVEVVFDSKTHWNGYYRVAGADASLTEWISDGGATVAWSFNLELVGNSNDADIESRLSGSPSLLNDYSAVGERWHAPPVGHRAYWSGSAQPSQVIRTGSDGAMVVYRGVGATVNPRFNCLETSYRLGRSRFVDADGFERSGTMMQLAATGWSLDNGLARMKIVPGSSTFEVSSWGAVSGVWRVKNFAFNINGIYPGPPVSASVIRNEYECVVVRVMWDMSPSGRTTIDFTLRRGSRLVELYARTMLSATIGLQPNPAELGVRTNGRMVAAANDANGNRYILGSARTFGWNLEAGYIAKSASVEFDMFIGSVVGGSAAVAGDTETDLYAQYLGAPSEMVEGIRL